jgi:hypothetical protein
MKMWDTTVADRFVLSMPGLAVFLGIATGVLSLLHFEACAAILGIGAAIASGSGIIATYFASKKRDEQIQFWIVSAGHTAAHIREGFGS